MVLYDFGIALACAYCCPRAGSVLITASTSLPGCERSAPIIHSRAILLAPISPHPSFVFTLAPPIAGRADSGLLFWNVPKRVLLERSNRLSIGSREPSSGRPLAACQPSVEPPHLARSQSPISHARRGFPSPPCRSYCRTA